MCVRLIRWWLWISWHMPATLTVGILVPTHKQLVLAMLNPRVPRVDGFPFPSRIAIPLWLGAHKLIEEFSLQSCSEPKHYFHRKRDHLWIALDMQPQEKQDKAKLQSEGIRKLIKRNEENRDFNYFRYLHLCETVVMKWEGTKNKIALISEAV